MDDKILRYGAATAATLFTGIGFAFKFLLDAKDYPQLSLVLLAVVAMAIGSLALLAACGVSALLVTEFQKAWTDYRSNAQRSKAKYVILLVAGAFLLPLIVMFLLIGFFSFHYSIENVADALARLRDQLLAQV
ncbi:hypothetical protein [Rhodovulum sulfidophilum]|uniref:hypothetical protein n=1 Tax=Rhodovulum sulfidophilum TaxID=35806 RepID=UPI001F19EECD|nr:hypothetical protein [Rhodovulum sulfidophilum]MCE8418863.1 hypothetical protein [Rhodovulum sulfidophilum]MCE8441147.1 hypothetical protein [Rhodovulum sulfidophilum]